MFSRIQLKELKKRLSEAKKFIQIITGPRQVGKTTLVEQLLEDIDVPYRYASADDIPATSTAWISEQWSYARRDIVSSKSSWGLLVIDEIQKIKNWSETIKKEWDQDKKNKVELKVILLGSSSLLIQQGLSESLTGRFEIIKLPHWSFNEMNEAFGYSPEEYVWFGGYPGAAQLIKNEKRWKEYILDSIIETTISKDIVSLVTINKPMLLKNLFELSCSYSGQILSYTKILGQLSDSGNTTTLTHYQSLLDKIWFTSGLSKYSTSMVSVKSSIPKWMVYNTALSSVYSGLDFKSVITKPELLGRHIESAVGAYLLNECKVNNRSLYYWREANKEVDFVLQNDRKIFAIEVKLSIYKDRRGIDEFNKTFKPVKTLVISKDTIPWQDFLKMELETLFEL